MTSYPIKYCKIHGPHAIINKYLHAGQQCIIEEFISKKIILFLDIDGVMNSHRYYNIYGEDAYFKWQEDERDEFGQPFDPISKALLNKLIEKHNIDIVISSSWRTTTKEMQELWRIRGMSGKVIGVTPRLSSRVRGEEIKEYLTRVHRFRSYNWNWWEAKGYYNDHFCDVDNYLIVDDDSDMLFEHRDHFIKTNYEEGFNQSTYDACDFICKNNKYLTPSQASLYRPRRNYIKLLYDKIARRFKH